MNHCPHCGWTAQDPGHSPDVCPSCSARLGIDPGAVQRTRGLISGYFNDLWEISVHPARFFRQMPLKGGFSRPLAFALVTHWLGSAAQYLWNLAIGGSLGKYLANLFQVAGDVADIDSPGRSAFVLALRDRVIDWIWGAGSVIADPFLTLASIFFTTFFVFLGARILVTPRKNGAPDDITFESALRIICFGLSPSIFAVIPLAGGAVATLWVILVTIVGAREVYRIGTGRAIVVALFPKLLFIGIMAMGLLILAVVLFKLVAAVF